MTQALKKTLTLAARRIAWTLSQAQTVWAALSRAVTHALAGRYRHRGQRLRHPAWPQRGACFASIDRRSGRRRKAGRLQSTAPRPEPWVAAVFLMVLPWAAASVAQIPERSEYDIKAAFLYSLGKYVNWPEPANAGMSAPFAICILGKDPFGKTLDDAARHQQIHDRTVVIRRLAGASQATACDVLFISASERDNLEAVLQSLNKAPVLTVGDMPQFAERGGMINLVTADRRVQFEVNVEAAERARLMPSSQLLRLAKLVADALPAM